MEANGNLQRKISRRFLAILFSPSQLSLSTVSASPANMQMQQTFLQRAVYELGLLPCYQMNGKNFYDTREVRAILSLDFASASAVAQSLELKSVASFAGSGVVALYCQHIVFSLKVFDRHNFARDVRRNVKPDDWIFLKPRYLLTEQGIVQFAFRKNVPRLVDKFMGIMDRPLISELPPTPVYPRQDQPSIPPVQHVKYDPIPQSPPQHAEDPLMTPAGDYNSTWETFEVPYSRPTSATNTAMASTGSSMSPTSMMQMQNNGGFQVPLNSSKGVARDVFASGFFGYDEPYYPAGSDAALKRKAFDESAEQSLSKRQRIEMDQQNAHFFHPSPPVAQSPVTYASF